MTSRWLRSRRRRRAELRAMVADTGRRNAALDLQLAAITAAVDSLRRRGR